GSSDTSISLSWTSGNGSNRIVIASVSSGINNLPANNVSYTANPHFGSGSTIGSGNYVVYKGTGNQVTVTGLENNKTYFFTVLEYNGSTGFEQYLTVSNPTINKNTYVRVDVKLFLEGPFNGTDMNTNINAILPDTQVYNVAPWNYMGTEQVASMPNADVVDWVLVELRQASTPGIALDTSIVGR